jgi:hypothetical protein
LHAISTLERLLGGLAVVAVLVGCGDDKPADGARAAPAASAAYAQPTIEEPENGAALEASSRFGEELTAKVTVRGQAEPATRVTVSTGCLYENCSIPTRTDADGAFEAKVTVATEVDQPRGTIIVSYDEGESLETDRVIVTISPPRAADLPTSPPKHSRANRPRSTSTPAPLPTSAPPEATAAPRTTTSAHNLIVIGDSLAVGMEPYLSQVLPGWSIDVDARIGRPLAEGMSRLAATPAPGRPTVYAFSLFTNDDPRSVGALESAVRLSARRGCAVWATIVRPPVGGTSYAAANARLESLASGGVRVVPWAAEVARHPEYVGGDGVHATPAGNRRRAELYAEEVKRCAA